MPRWEGCPPWPVTPKRFRPALFPVIETRQPAFPPPKRARCVPFPRLTECPLPPSAPCGFGQGRYQGHLPENRLRCHPLQGGSGWGWRKIMAQWPVTLYTPCLTLLPAGGGGRKALPTATSWQDSPCRKTKPGEQLSPGHGALPRPPPGHKGTSGQKIKPLFTFLDI